MDRRQMHLRKWEYICTCRKKHIMPPTTTKRDVDDTSSVVTANVNQLHGASRCGRRYLCIPLAPQLSKEGV